MDEGAQSLTSNERRLPAPQGHRAEAQAPSGPPSHVVGIGASAGGLEALEALFDNMRPDSGLAFVVIQHLSPDFRSLMDELLSRHTKIAIHRVEHEMEVRRNAIYLIPPRKEMIISGGRLLLTDKDPSQGLSMPIDTFFRSLAQDAGPNSVAIVLSGTGSDGSRGIRSIHDAGGLVIAQREETAKFNGMPRSAIDTGIVDLVLPPEAIPDALLEHIEHPDAIRSAFAGARGGGTEQGLSAIFSILRDEHGMDFSLYKPNTVARRIDRRLQLHKSSDLDEYVERLRRDPEEVNLLYKDLLIGVTKFFRDGEAFERLEKEVVAPLIERISNHDELRAWVAGCATGEEAYSLAILFDEAVTAADRKLDVKVFATDVHRASLDFASAGQYDEAALSEVSPERLERYFERLRDGYRVSSDLRKMIVFAPHNVIKDAPFTKLDLVSCRNLLIYLQPHAQREALSLFHFALKPGGTLFLGSSETPIGLADEFDTIDHHWKIYRKRRDVRLPATLRLPLTPTLRPRGVETSQRMSSPGPSQPKLLRAYDALLAEYVPPSVLVDEQRHLVHAFAGAGRLLRVPDGRVSSDVLQLVPEQLRSALSTALQRAAHEQSVVSYSGVPLNSGDGRVLIRLNIKPLTIASSGVNYFLISFENQQPPAPPASDGETQAEIDLSDVSQRRVAALEGELRYAKENLQATIEETETTHEELQATNEELVASNEELQSTNEELHSVNEELYTVNAEHQRKISELTELTDDMDNLLRSTEIGTIFLDRDLCIRKFTPKIGETFQVLPQDIGRPLESFSHNILHDTFQQDVRRVLETHTVFEKDVQDRNGNWFLLRINPYRSQEGVEGVVITLIDISLLKAAERELKRMSQVFMDGADPIIIEDLSGKIVEVNHEAERVYGWTREGLIGQHVSLLVPPQERKNAERLRARCRNAEHVRNVESVRETKSGKVRPVLLTLSLLSDENGTPTSIATIAKDITARKKAEQQARTEIRRRDQFLAMLSHELRNPLAAVLNATEVLERDESDSATAKQARNVILRQTRQMARLLDDLLDVSRVTQGKIQIRKEVLDLARLVDDAVLTVRPLVDQRRHELVVDVSATPVWVEGDAARLLQIQENLLTNAAKYTPSGGHIRICVLAEDDQAVVRVQDDGQGIEPEMLKEIFDPFVQSDTAREQSNGGMGIGLTLVRNLVRLHGGRITAHSEGAGRGSVFEVRLPRTEHPPSESEESEAPPPAAKRILIVEDQQDSRQMLARLLEMEGYTVLTAENGATALEAIGNERPDVALIDIGLPDLDGMEVARRVKAELAESAVRLVALTGYGRKEDRQAIFAAGFDEHLVKPISPDHLERVLRKPAAG